MKSKKDQGNAFFKKQNYPSAIQCYKQYVSKQNSDNCKAYSNMALSYFKIKQYQNCIQACERAVELQPQFEKPFYRMFEAYKQLNDQYGMVISASRFCKLSKQEKDVKVVQKQIAKVKEQLAFRYMRGQQGKDRNKNLSNSGEDKVIDEIVSSSYGNRKQSQSTVVNKQPQMCKQSKWSKIVQITKQNKRQGLNLAIKFINQQCQSSLQQKQKYRKLYNKLRTMPQIQQSTNVDDNKQKQSRQSSQQQQQEIKVQELQKYAQEKKRKQVEQQSQQQKHQQQKRQQQSQPQLQSQQQQNQTQHQPIQSPQSQQPQQQQQHSSQQKHQQSQHQQTTTDNNNNNTKNNNQNWQDFITKQQSQLLFNQHINNNIIKSQDPFTTFYQSLANTLRSPQLDKFQKQAILSLCPTKVKKFNMLMKSYSGKQKQQLQQLFVQNHLHHIWQQKFVSPNINNVNGNNKK